MPPTTFEGNQKQALRKHLNFSFLSTVFPRQGLMYQQQELYRHQQEALARLQDEADRLRQETLVVINGDSFLSHRKMC